jgi:hypothetical protein
MLPLLHRTAVSGCQFETTLASACSRIFQSFATLHTVGRLVASDTAYRPSYHGAEFRSLGNAGVGTDFRSEIDAWAADVVHYRPGQQENLVQMAGRVSAFLGDLHATAEPEAVIVCHAGVIKMIAAWENGLGSVGIAQRAAQSKDEFSYGCCIDINIVM